MKTTLLLMLSWVFLCAAQAQNVFNPADPILRYDASQPLGSPQRPDTSKPGLQKFVSIPTNGISTGTNAWNASSFKSYFFNYNGRKFAFRLKFPRSYTNNDSATKKYPLMLFFHGAGEVGCVNNGGIWNNEKQLALGAPLFMERVDKNQFDGFLLYPQLVPANNLCWGDWGGVGVTTIYNALLKLLDSMVKYTRLDNDRVLVTGLSAGGLAAFYMAKGYPQRIASVAPSAATGLTSGIPAFVHIPIWFATGQKDSNPSSAKATGFYNTMKNAGTDIRFSHYKNVGHAAWTAHWKEADFVPFMNAAHKANPLVFFQRNQVCPDSSLEVRLGITGGFHSYEWQRNNVTIATRTGTANSITDPATVSSFTGNEIVVKNYGTYRVRFKRTAGSAWTVWSPKPASLTVKETTQAKAIQVDGLRSKVLPAPDGSTTVPLILPEGYINYQWFRASDNSLVSSERTFNAPVGTYRAKYAEPQGCGSSFSPDFVVVNANATPRPNAASNLVALPLDNNRVRLTWKDNAANETGFEVYKSSAPGGPYKLIAITARNVVTYTDAAIEAGDLNYYIVRTINNTSASAPTNEATVKSEGDKNPPTAPGNLQYRGSTINSIFLRWTASTDDEGIKRYDIYANGSKMLSTTNTQIEIPGLDSAKLYAFMVKAVDNAGNESPASNQAVGYTHRQGFNYKYYNGTFSLLPNFNTLTPVKTGYVDSITFGASIRTQVNYYGLLYTGYIYIPQTATYTFEVNSDDGSKLYIGVPYSHSANAVVNNDSVHTSRTVSGTVQLNAGYHPFSVAYFDRNGSERLQLFWSNNAGLARETIPKHFFALNGTSLPAAPAAPTTFAATALDYQRIRLSWQDRSNNETGFEISRSLTSTGTYSAVQTVGAGQTSYIDLGLNAATQYFYRIRSIGLGGNSSYATATATTPAAPLVPAGPTDLTATAIPGGNISVSWNDNATNEVNYLVYRRAGNTGAFSLIATLPANSTAYSDNAITNGIWYHYYVIARNASGNSIQSNTAQAIAGNNPPTIAGLADIFVKAGSSQNADFSVTDASEDIVSVSLVSAPAFVRLTNPSTNIFRLTVSTTEHDMGTYSLIVQASDDKGSHSRKEVTLIVGDKNTRSVLINFGSSSAGVAAPWNNWLGNRAANSTLNNLRDERGQATGFSLTSIQAWRSTAVLGHITGNNSGVYKDSVLAGGIMDTALQLQFRISGLNQSMRYNLVFLGSQNEGIEAISEYSSGTSVSRLDARYNTNKTANLNGLTPDANGRITVTIKRISPGSANYLNALAIEEYSPSVPIIHPTNLYAELAADGLSVGLSWSDRSANEAASGGFILERANDSTFSSGLLTKSFNANTTFTIDNEISANQKYWYRIRAKSSTNQLSAYSNRIGVTSPLNTVFVNFNYTVPPVEDGVWNNTMVSPTITQPVMSLKNSYGLNTGIQLAIDKIFNGEFSAGMSTGNNSGIVPDNVLMSNYWLDNTQISSIRLSGLNHGQRYRIGFFGSSSPEGWYKGNYTATYTVNAKKVYLNSWMNRSKIVYLDDLVPDDNGELLVEFSTTDAAQYGFNAGLIIQSYTGAASGRQEEIPVDSSGAPPSDSIPVEEAPDQTLVRLYPNPFVEVINVQLFHEKAGGNLRTEIHDLNGRLIHRRDFANMPAGSNTVSLYIGDAQFRHGTYMLSIYIDNKLVKSTKIMRASK